MTAPDQQTHDIGLISLEMRFSRANERIDTLPRPSQSWPSADWRCLGSAIWETARTVVWRLLKKVSPAMTWCFSFGGIARRLMITLDSRPPRLLGLPLVLHDQARELIALRCQESGPATDR